jgi:hypothetical protein
MAVLGMSAQTFRNLRDNYTVEAPLPIHSILTTCEKILRKYELIRKSGAYITTSADYAEIISYFQTIFSAYIGMINNYRRANPNSEIKDEDIKTLKDDIHKSMSKFFPARGDEFTSPLSNLSNLPMFYGKDRTELAKAYNIFEMEIMPLIINFIYERIYKSYMDTVNMAHDDIYRKFILNSISKAGIYPPLKEGESFGSQYQDRTTSQFQSSMRMGGQQHDEPFSLEKEK